MKRGSVICLLLLSVLLLVSHTLYVIKTDQFPQGGLDEPVYIENAVTNYDLLRKDPIGNLPRLVKINADRQPLYPLFLAIPLLMFGTDYAYKMGLWINVLFYVTTVVSLYYLGKKYLSPMASFLASYIFAFYGFPLFYLHFTYSETSVTAFITLSLAFLVWSDNFTNRVKSVMFSIAFAVACLTRWVAPLFIIGPLAVIMIQSFIKWRREKRNRRNTFWVGIALFLVVGVLPSILLYYGPQLKHFQEYITSNMINSRRWSTQFLGMSASDGVFSSRSVMYYLNVLSQQGIYFWVLFCAGFLVCVRYLKRYGFIVIGFAVPYAIFTFATTWKGDRFILPIYPFMALISAALFDHIRRRGVRRFFIICTLAIGLLNFLGASWGVGPLGKQGLKDIVLPAFIHHPRRIYLTTIVWPPRSDEGNVYTIVQALTSDWGSQHGPFTYVLTFYMPQIENGLGEIFFHERRGIASEFFLYGIPENRFDAFLLNIRQADYVLVKDGVVDGKYNPTDSPIPDATGFYFRKFNTMLRMRGAHLPEGYRRIRQITIPFDRSTVSIYRKYKTVSDDAWRKFMGVL